MTVIAYDGHYVAADRLIVNDGGLMGTCQKLTVWEGVVLATCGAADHGEALMIWWKDGKNPAAYPFRHGGETKDAYMYVFEYEMPVLCFQTWPSPILFPMAEFAAGSGNDIARTALHLGRDAREAVKIACDLNVYCGGGVDYVDLTELKLAGTAPVRSYAGA